MSEIILEVFKFHEKIIQASANFKKPNDDAAKKL